MAQVPDIVEFTTDPQLLGLRVSPTQACLLKTIYGLPLTPEEAEIFMQCTGRASYPRHGFAEATVIAGARAGKDSRIAAPTTCYEAIFGGHERHVAKGERAMIPLVAQDHRATRVAFGYIKSYLLSSPVLASMIEEMLSLEIHLTNRISIVCFPCTQRSLRGWSIPAAVLDELAFFRLEGQADSDAEIQASLRRGMIAFPSTRLLKVSTPYMRSGVVYEDFIKHWGHDSPDVLVWRAASVLMNPSLRTDRLERERRLDPVRYLREYEAEFAEDLEALLPSAWVEAAVVAERHELPPMDGVAYVAACDPSGGGQDTFALTICHAEGRGAERRVVQDVLKGWTGSRRASPLDLAGVVRDIAAILRRYRLGEVRGDRYAAGWVRQAFEREGIRYREAEWDKSAAYLEAEPAFAQGQVALLDHPTQLRQLKLLERRPRPGGRTVVDHPHGGHDDLANVLALAVAALLTTPCPVSAESVAGWMSTMFALQRDGPFSKERWANRASGDPIPWPRRIP
jgi:hypothetical protein